MLTGAAAIGLGADIRAAPIAAEHRGRGALAGLCARGRRCGLNPRPARGRCAALHLRLSGYRRFLSALRADCGRRQVAAVGAACVRCANGAAEFGGRRRIAVSDAAAVIRVVLPGIAAERGGVPSSDVIVALVVHEN